MTTDQALMALTIWGIVVTTILIAKALNGLQRRAGRRFPRQGASIQPYQQHVDDWNATHPNDEIEGWKP